MADSNDNDASRTDAERTQGGDPTLQAIFSTLRATTAAIERGTQVHAQETQLLQQQLMTNQQAFLNLLHAQWNSSLMAIQQVHDHQMDEMQQQLEYYQQMLRAPLVPEERVTVSVPRAAEENRQPRDDGHPESSLLRGTPPIVIEDAEKRHGQQRPVTWCSTCRVNTHSTKVCRTRQGVCHVCKVVGHIAKNCPQKQQPRAPVALLPSATTVFKKKGGTSFQRPIRLWCHVCRLDTHLTQDCRMRVGACHNCKQIGHIARNCPLNESSPSRSVAGSTSSRRPPLPSQRQEFRNQQMYTSALLQTTETGHVITGTYPVYDFVQ